MLGTNAACAVTGAAAFAAEAACAGANAAAAAGGAEEQGAVRAAAVGSSDEWDLSTGLSVAVAACTGAREGSTFRGMRVVVRVRVGVQCACECVFVFGCARIVCY